jgi:hypothetical protein
MMRFLGVLMGSALAVGALVVFIGIPEFTTEESVADNTIITLPMRPAERSGAQPGSDAEFDRDPSPDPAPSPSAPDEMAVASNTVATAAVESPGPPPQPETLPQPIADIPIELQAPQETRHWYAFWSPFRSEIAASGFVDQLQRVTGLDYRVVKVRTGLYEVAFAYEDDDEITFNLSQITAATGLQLPEG